MYLNNIIDNGNQSKAQEVMLLTTCSSNCISPKNLLNLSAMAVSQLKLWETI